MNNPKPSSMRDQMDGVFAAPAERVAVMTCDVEPDFGNRTGTCELLEDRKYLDALIDNCRSLGVPLSAFIVTAYLERELGFVAAVLDDGLDVHAHSHSHDIGSYRSQSAREIEESQRVFRRVFGRDATGYRAPQGVLVSGDPAALADNGFAFSASVFPSRRRGVFDFRDMPQVPWRWKSGVVELPFASTVPGRRMVTVSYLKLLGKLYWHRVLRCVDNLPPILIIDSHLHDFFEPRSFANLPMLFRLAYRRNRRNGFTLMAWLILRLRALGYRFVSVEELYQMVSNGSPQWVART